jgi:hypothetical protein
LRGCCDGRRNPISDAPFNNDWIGSKSRAKTFNVLVQCFPQFSHHRSEFLVLLCGKELGGESANFIFYPTHGAALHQDDAVARQ